MPGRWGGLLDTCALTWFLRGDSELPDRAAGMVEDPGCSVFVSVVSIWEIAIKAALGKLRIPVGLEDFLESDLRKAGFEIHADGIPACEWRLFFAAGSLRPF